VAVETLPLTLSGKLDRAALLGRLTAATTLPEKAGVTPKEIVTNLFRQLLGDASLSAHDDFFAAGGNSLIALQAVTIISQRLGTEVELRALYRNPTASALCRSLSQGGPKPTRLAALRAPQPGGLDVFFLPPVLGLSQVFSDLARGLPAICNP